MFKANENVIYRDNALCYRNFLTPFFQNGILIRLWNNPSKIQKHVPYIRMSNSNNKITVKFRTYANLRENFVDLLHGEAIMKILFKDTRFQIIEKFVNPGNDKLIN